MTVDQGWALCFLLSEPLEFIIQVKAGPVHQLSWMSEQYDRRQEEEAAHVFALISGQLGSCQIFKVAFSEGKTGVKKNS
jgi:hypothetical protein